MHRSLRILLFPLLAVLAGCSNPFSDNYNGETFQKTRFAVAALKPPADGEKIGRSEFTTDTADWGQSDAIEAAKKVGANVVVWHRKEAGERPEIEQETVYSGTTASGATNTIQIPVRVKKMFYTYTAEFYRTQPGEMTSDSD